MLYIEYKVKKFLEDKRTENKKLEDLFLELKKIDELQRLAGYFVEHKHKKNTHRAKYRRKRIFNLGFWQVSWKNIAIGKR